MREGKGGLSVKHWRKLAIKIEIFTLFWKPYVTPLLDPKMFIF
jgi:hypothetical protein